MEAKAHIHSALSNSLKLLNLLIVGVTAYFCASIVNRAIGDGSPEIFGIPIAQENAIYVLIASTIFHVIVLRYIIHYIRLAWINLSKKEREELYFQITGTNHLLTHGAERLRDAIINRNGFLFVYVDKDDPPSLLHWSIFFAAVFASIRYELSFDFVWTFLLGVTLAMANWQIGSSWLVALADLGRAADSSLYFDDPGKRGPRYFGLVSGPWHGMNNNIFLFFAISLLDAFIRVLPISIVVFFGWLALEVLLLLFSK
ncbi:hypothetical protein [Marinobacter sp. DUT-1]|uniref:hypothetical protein n=1 Tax=Marinobacter sp. DUT-1 TaxID=3412037 RepID=UPI003D175965